MQYPQMWGPQAYEEDLPTSCLDMIMRVFVFGFVVVLVISAALMGVDWLFDTSFASDFLEWVSGLVKKLGD